MTHVHKTLFIAAFLVLTHAPSLIAQNPGPDCTGSAGAPVTTNDEYEWPSQTTRYEVLGNDYDLEGNPLSVTGSIPVPPSVGSAVISSDARAIIFTPAPTKPSTNVSFTYTASDGSHSTQGTVSLQVAPPAPQSSLTLTYKCDSMHCYFKAVPQGIDNIRAYGWAFDGAGSGCSKPEWRGPTLYCMFPNGGTFNGVVTAYLFSGAVYKSPPTPITVNLTPANAEWKIKFTHGDRGDVTESLDAAFEITYTDPSRERCGSCLHKWDFGDESPVVVSGTNPTNLGWIGGIGYHRYAKPGIYNVSLIVDETNPTYFTKTIQVYNRPPRFDTFDVYKEFVTKPEEAGVAVLIMDEHGMDPFTEEVHPSAPKTVEIDWGDGTLWTQKITPGKVWDYCCYKYKKPGQYTVIGKSTDAEGAVGTAQAQYVVTNVPPKADFTFDCDPVTRKCRFDGSSSVDDGEAIGSYIWSAESATPAEQSGSNPVFETTFDPACSKCRVMLAIQDQQEYSDRWDFKTRLVQFPAHKSAPLDYYTLTPRRIFDSRANGGAPLTNATPTVIDLNACCGISLPGYAAAMVNVSALQTTGEAAVQLAPGTFTQDGSEVSRPTSVSATLASNAVVTIHDGRFTLSVPQGSTHVVVDLFGYFAPAGHVPATNPALNAAGPLRFDPVTPCRLVDSRVTPPRLVSGTDYPLAIASQCGVSADAKAVTGNLAAILGTSMPANAFLRLRAATLATPPPTSDLNIKEGYIRGNGVWPSLGRSGAADVNLTLSAGSTDFVFDITGYFRPGDYGLRYVAMNPCHLNVLATNSFEEFDITLEHNVERSIKVAGHCGIPKGARAAVISHRVGRPYTSGHLEMFVRGDRPRTSVANFSASSTDPSNNLAFGTSVVMLAENQHDDIALVSNFFTHNPAGYSDPIPDPVVRADLWVWGYFLDVPVPNDPPAARFTFNCWATKCTFDAGSSSDTDGSIAKYEWKFLSSGSFVAGQPLASYTFAGDGDYAVQLRVTDNRGAATILTRVLNIRTAASLPGMNYFAVPNCRLYDSTTAVTASSIPVRGQCGIPAGTDALIPVFNVAIPAPGSGSGKLTIGRGQPLSFSAEMLPLSFHHLPVMLAGESALAYTVQPAARVIVDVVGYYRASDVAPGSPARGPFRFTPLDPCRIFDSRTTPPQLDANARLDISLAGRCGLPAGAAITAVNLTAVNPVTSGGAHIKLFSSHLTALPPTSSLNIVNGINRPNFVLSELGSTNGAAKDVALWLNAGSTHYVLDSHGYYSAASTQKYTALAAPVAIRDLPDPMPSHVPLALTIGGNSGVPKHATAAVLQIEGSGTTTGGHMILYAADKPRPATSVINLVANQTTPVTNTVIAPLSATGDVAAIVSLAVQQTAKISVHVLGYFSDPNDWGPGGAQIEWAVASQIGLNLDLDVASINIDPNSPDHWYYVDWGDGSARWIAETGSALLNARPAHTYASTGARNVTVAVVRRSDGAEVKFTKNVRIGNAAPVVKLTFDCTRAPVCTFDASGSTDDYNEIQRYFWDIPGGATTTTEPRLTHQFPGEGTYNIVVTATDGALESEAVRRSVQVRVPGTRTAYLFQPVQPCRLYDSRAGAPLSAGVPFSLKVTEGTCGLPTHAKAAALTVAIVSATNSGWLHVYQPGRLTDASSLNFTATSVPRSNHATTAIGADGKVELLARVVNAGTAHVIVDVTGYYLAEGAGIAPAQGLGFRTLAPCRIHDSRTTTPQSPLVSGTASLIRIASTCGIPAVFPTEGGAAAALNLTMIASPTIGNVTATPSGGTESFSTSTVNVLPQKTHATAVSIGLGRQPNDDVRLRFVSTAAGNSIHWTLDTTGYWAVGNELRYYPLPGCRMLDSREFAHGYPRLARGVEQRIQARGNCGVPIWAKAVAVNATAINPESDGWLQMWAAGAAQPVSSIVNWSAGEPAVGNMTIVPVGAQLPDLAIKAAASGADLVLDVYGYYANPADVPAGYFPSADEEEDR